MVNIEPLFISSLNVPVLEVNVDLMPPIIFRDTLNPTASK